MKKPHVTFSLPELFAATADEQVELFIEREGFAISKAGGDPFTHCLGFDATYPEAVVMVARDDLNMVSTLFIRERSGLYRLEREAVNETPAEVFDAHDRYVARIAERKAIESMFKLGNVAHIKEAP